MNRRRRRTLFAIACVLAPLGACGGEISGGGSPSGGSDGTTEGGADPTHDAGPIEGGPAIDGGVRDASTPDAADAGSAWFFPYEHIDTPSLFTATAVALGDVNGDGTIDAVVTGILWPNNSTSIARAFFVFAGDGHGGFAQATTTTIEPYGSPPNAIVVGDVTGDGRSDVIVGLDSAVVVYPQTAAGTLGTPVRYTRPSTAIVSALLLADVDDDGVAEIVALAGGSVIVYRRDGSGGLVLASQSPFAAGGAGAFAMGALGGSGRHDLVGTVDLGLGHGSQVTVASEGPDGGFVGATKYDVDATESVSRLAVGDVDGDGLTDVVVTVGGNRPQSKLAVLTQRGGVLRSVRELPSYDIPKAVYVVDVNGDGRNDVVVMHSTWMAVGVYVQLATGALADEVRVDFEYIQGDDMAVGDIDGNGRVDLVAATGGGLVVLRHLP